MVANRPTVAGVFREWRGLPWAGRGLAGNPVLPAAFTRYCREWPATPTESRAEEVARLSMVSARSNAKERRREANRRGMRHSVISCFAIVGGFMAFALFGLWSLGAGRMPLTGWAYAAVWALVAVGGGIVASLPVRFVFWVFQRPRHRAPEPAPPPGTH